MFCSPYVHIYGYTYIYMYIYLYIYIYTFLVFIEFYGDHVSQVEREMDTLTFGDNTRIKTVVSIINACMAMSLSCSASCSDDAKAPPEELPNLCPDVVSFLAVFDQVSLDWGTVHVRRRSKQNIRIVLVIIHDVWLTRRGCRVYEKTS